MLLFRGAPWFFDSPYRKDEKRLGTSAFGGRAIRLPDQTFPSSVWNALRIPQQFAISTIFSAQNHPAQWASRTRRFGSESARLEFTFLVDLLDVPPMKHVIVCREYRPAPDPPGGIGTYVGHLARLLAQSGETVHVIAQRWEGAPSKVTESCGGRLVVHRVSLDDLVQDKGRTAPEERLLQGLAGSDGPSRAFSWQVAHVTERLVETEGIDLIEGSEWEAPLYYFQLRRALGLGPKRQPPCLVQLHSPAELIFRHNDWDLTLSDYEPLRRVEEFTVRAADLVLCPSRYLARQCERIFNLTPGEVQVIPYPLGDTPRLERDPDVWRRNSICYTGRLELRKGVVEWVDAAVEVAQTHPSVEFDFIGGDTSLDGGPGRSVRGYLDARIPRPLRERFHFHGSIPREELMKALAKIPVAVVPSRWENLPYSCIEAMCTGLPVLVSPTGGMTELITDGESGWVAPDQTAAGLASALRRVLDTAPGQRAAMGGNAEAAARRICSNETVVQQQLELRTRLIAAGVSRSIEVPAPAISQASGPQRPGTQQGGMAVVVNCGGDSVSLAECLKGIQMQTQPAKAVVVIGAAGQERAVAGEATVEFLPASSHITAHTTARNTGLQHILQSAPLVRGIVFLTEAVRLEPQYLKLTESVLERHPGVGLVSSFLRYERTADDLEETPGPGGHWTFDTVDKMPCAALRVEALQSEALQSGDVSATWTAVTYPDILASVVSLTHGSTLRGSGHRKRYSAMTLAVRGSARLKLNWFLAAPWSEKARWVRQVLKEPRRTAQWLAWQLRAATRTR
jgi:glycogen synthase